MQRSTAAVERLRGELDAKNSEAQSRAAAEHEQLGARLDAAAERHAAALLSLAPRSELAEVRAAGEAAGHELTQAIASLKEQWRSQQEELVKLHAANAGAASSAAVERAEASVSALAAKVNQATAGRGALGAEERAAYARAIQAHY